MQHIDRVGRPIKKLKVKGMMEIKMKESEVKDVICYPKSGKITKRYAYVWGDGREGRLGMGHQTSYEYATLNPNLEKIEIESIVVGPNHSILITCI